MEYDPAFKNQHSRYFTLILFIIITMLISAICCAEDSSNPLLLKDRTNTSGIITISEGLQLATEKNRIIKIASLNKDIAHTDILVAQSRFLPSIDASANYTFFAHQPGFRFGTQNAYSSEKSFPSYGVNIYQTLYDFGARTSKYEASKNFLETTKLDIARTRNLVALDFITAYFDLLETEKMILVSQKEVERLESHLQVAQNLYQEGVITKNDLLQAEVKLSDARQKLLTTKNVRAVHTSKINTILARPLKEEFRVVEVPVNNFKTIDLENAWEYAEKQRTELQIIDQELKIAGLEETVKKSEYYPTIFALGGYNYSENRYMLHDDNWSLIFGLNLNLFSGGSTKAEVAKIKYKQDQLLEQRSKLL
ncbi:MAG: TolC family protein, partial [Nitrospirota bacterium]|nr:TolC family protein [Nitrospirota bacterium]